MNYKDFTGHTSQEYECFCSSSSRSSRIRSSSNNITIIKSSNLQSLLKYRHLKILTESNLSCLDEQVSQIFIRQSFTEEGSMKRNMLTKLHIGPVASPANTNLHIYSVKSNYSKKSHGTGSHVNSQRVEQRDLAEVMVECH